MLRSSLTLATAASCSKDDAMPPGPQGIPGGVPHFFYHGPLSDYISYDNESGGTTTLNNVPLPAAYRFKHPMKRGDDLSLLASLDGDTAASEITAAILLNGQEVKKETGRGADAQTVPVYVIGQ